MSAPRIAALALLGLLAATPGAAHPLAPSLLELTELRDGAVVARFRTPRLAPRGERVAPRLPGHCTRTQPARELADEVAHTTWWSLDCGSRGLVGAELGATGLAGSGTDLLVQVRLADGRQARALLGAERPRWRVPPAESRWEVARSYAALGVAHLLGGWDHGLFLIGLALLVGGWRRLALAVTAFTLGHSATLAAATLGWLPGSAGLVEIGIAASLVALACELARGPERPGPLRRRPALLCLGFGLLHGLGFAGALAETGLPAGAIPLALAAFNVGIELGQLALLGAALGALGLATRLAPRALALPSALPSTVAHGLGAAGVWLVLDRIAGLR